MQAGELSVFIPHFTSELVRKLTILITLKDLHRSLCNDAILYNFIIKKSQETIKLPVDLCAISFISSRKSVLWVMFCRLIACLACDCFSNAKWGKGTFSLSASCQFYIVVNHNSLYCRLLETEKYMKGHNKRHCTDRTYNPLKLI